jgi:hypothetical protein
MNPFNLKCKTVVRPVGKPRLMTEMVDLDTDEIVADVEL